MRTHVHVLMRDAEGRKKEASTVKQQQGKHLNELPRVGLKPTTFYTLGQSTLPAHTTTHSSPLFHPSSYGGHSHTGGGGGGGGGGEDHGSSGYGGPPSSSDMYSSVSTDDQYYSSFADNCTSPYVFVCSLMPCCYGLLPRPCCRGY